MSIYRRKWKVKGAERVSPRFTIEVRHPVTGALIRRKGPKDKKSAQQMESDLVRDLERGQAGLKDLFKDERAKSFKIALDDFIADLKSDGRDSTYIYICDKRMNRLFMECGWKTLFDVTMNDWAAWKRKAKTTGWNDRPTTGKTINQFLATLRKFLDWSVKHDRVDANRLVEAEKAREVSNDNYRRPATIEEMSRFLPSLPTDDLRRFYIFTAYTALRRGSLQALTWEDLDLDPEDPAVFVQAEKNKVRRKQRFALRKDVAAMLLAAKSSDDRGSHRVFPRVPTIDQHREYLAAAKIDFDDGHGKRRLDLHAFRKTLHTWMEDAGVDVREASKALGHLHLATTMKSYREKRPARREDGVERLPSLLDTGKPNAGKPEKD